MNCLQSACVGVQPVAHRVVPTTNIRGVSKQHFIAMPPDRPVACRSFARQQVFASCLVSSPIWCNARSVPNQRVVDRFAQLTLRTGISDGFKTQSFVVFGHFGTFLCLSSCFLGVTFACRKHPSSMGLGAQKSLSPVEQAGSWGMVCGCIVTMSFIRHHLEFLIGLFRFGDHRLK